MNLRVPVQFGVTDGPTLTVQDITERKVPLVINKQKHVGFAFTSKDLTLTVDRFGDRYLDSAAIALANVVDVDGLTLAYQSASHAVGTPGTIPNQLKVYNQAGAKLDKAGTPYDGNRYVVISPDMQVEIVDSLKGLFQSTVQIKQQYEKGRMGTAAGFDWSMDQNVRTHISGPQGGVPLISGGAQTGASILTKGWTAAAASRLKKGDVVTFAGSYDVNPVSGDQYADLRQFVVTADFASLADGTGLISIDPPLTVTGPYKTASASPIDGAAIVVSSAAGVSSPQGLAYHKEAMALAMVPLEMPQGVHFAARQTDKDTGASLRIVSQYDIVNDVFATRVDAMYGWACPIPQFLCRIQS